jgi:hypothetical protein
VCVVVVVVVIIIIIIIIIIAITLTVRQSMFLGCYSGTDLMLGNVSIEMGRIFVFTAMTVSLWFE